MLLVLTGDIQTGKTTWLLDVVARLEAGGVAVEGVVAPGVWRPAEPGDPAYAHASTALGAGAVAVPLACGLCGGAPARYDKLGIDNLLLPGHERVAFARREDLARAAGSYDAGSQAAKAGLGWHIDDRAIERVNAHFDMLASEPPCARADGGVQGGSGHRMLVVDELGRLELMRGEGLTRAMALLARGPQGRYDHALVVARSAFGLDRKAAELFGDAWGGAVFIEPGAAAWDAWLAPLAD